MRHWLIALSLLLFLATPSFSAEKPAKIVRAADHLAVFDLEITGQVDRAITRPLSENIRSEVIRSGKYKVMERSQMDKVLKEQAFQMTGCVAKECMVEAGQLLGVGKIIIGSLGLVGRTYHLSLSQVNVETGETEQMAVETCKCEVDELIESSGRAARRLMGEAVPETPAVTTVGIGTPTTVSPSPAVKTYRDPTTGMEFVFIKGGCYEMGDTFGDGSSGEKPVHEVCVDDFYLGKYEVTVGQFRAFVNATGYRAEAEKGDGAYHFTGSEAKMGANINWRNPGFSQTDDHPVVCVSYHDAVAFVEWLSRTAGKTYRLPTEAEWEYAARSGGKRYKYSWGNGSPSGNINDISLKREFPKRLDSIWEGYNDGYAFTAPVGSFPPNELGLYDMTGNVSEWCSDWFGEKYYSEGRRTNPQGPDSGQLRVIRGGSWDSSPWNLRASLRVRGVPSFRGDGDGFRLAFSAR